MTQSNAFEVGYKMSTSQALLMAMGATNSLQEALVEENYTSEELNEMVAFGNSLTEGEGLDDKTVNRAVADFIEGLRELKAMYDASKGYEEMGELNLSISDEYQASEEEGEQFNELDKKESQGGTK